MKAKLLSLMVALIPALGFAQALNFTEGRDYTVLPNPETINSNVIVVREFFWYGCPHCYALEPHMQKWAKARASDVAFFQTPAAMNPVWEVGARAFYTAQELGVQEKTHQALFDAMQKDGKKLSNPEAIADWYAAQGVDREKFTNLYNSFTVSNKIARSQAGAKRYNLDGVPAVVVHGKYVVTGEDARVPQVVDFLVNKIRSER